MYASQLWCNFRKSCMQSLRAAYNFECRTLYNLPWRASVRSHQVQCNILTFEALLRKFTYLFPERCRKSNNMHGRPQNFFQGGEVDILLLFFRLLAMQRKWTYTKTKCPCPMLLQQLETVFAL